MGLPPGMRSTHPLLPSGVAKEAASKSRAAAGRFNFNALLKSICCVACFAGSFTALFAASLLTGLASCRASRESVAVTPRSRLRLAQRDSAQPVGDDMETSTAHGNLGTVALRSRTTGTENLARFGRIFLCGVPACVACLAGDKG